MVDVWEELLDFCMEFSAYTLGYQRALFPYFALHDHIHARNVGRFARVFSELIGVKSPADRALLECAAYLHDCGMALPPKLVNKLELAARYIERDSPGTLEELERKLGDRYRRYFEKGVLELEAGVPLSYSDALVVRELHPWISWRYIEKYLPGLLKSTKLGSLNPLEISETIALLAKWHNASIRLHDFERNVGGYTVSLKPLAQVLRLADAMDFSRRRGKFIYEHLVGDLKEKAPSQMKHWIFKMAVEDVRFSYKQRTLYIDVEGGGRREAVSAARLFGIMLFEIGKNTLNSGKVSAEELQRLLRVTVVFEGREVDLKELRRIEKCSKCLKDLKLADLESEDVRTHFADVLEYALQLFEDLKREAAGAGSARANRLVKEPDVFDLFAHALYDGRVDLLQRLWRLLEARCWELLVKGKCPARAPMLKRLFESFQVEW